VGPSQALIEQRQDGIGLPLPDSGPRRQPGRRPRPDRAAGCAPTESAAEGLDEGY
jgi:hypothetical protein